MVEVGADVGGLQSAIGDAMDTLGSFSDQVQDVGTVLTGLGTAGIAGIGKMTSDAADLESQFAEISTIMDDGAGAADVYGDEVRRLSEEFAASGGQAEVTEGLYQTLSAGIEEGAEATQFLEDAMQFGTAALTDTETAVDGLSSVINAYGMEADEAGDVSDVMFTAIEEGKLTGEELAGSLSDVVGAAADANIEFEEIGGAMAEMTSQGMKADNASTNLNATIMELMDPSGELAEIIQELGYESGRAMLEAEGLEGTMALLGGHVSDTDAEMDDLFTTTQGYRGAAALAANEGEGFADTMDAMEDRSGAVDEAFEEMADTTNFQLRQAVNQARNAFTEFGTVLLAELQPVVERFANLIENLTNWFHDLDSGTQSLLAQVALLGTTFAATAGPILMLAPALATVSAGMVATATIVGTLMTAVGALSAAWITDWANIRTETQRVLSVLRDEFGPIVGPLFDTIGETVTALADRFGLFGGGAESSIGRVVTAIADGLISAIRTLGALIRGDIPVWSTIFQTAMTTIRSVVTTGFQAVRQVVTTALGQIRTLAETHLGQTVTAVQSRFQQIRTAITTALQTVRTTVQTSLAQIQTLWQTHSQAVLTALRTGYQQVRTVVQTVLQTLTTTVQTVLTRIQQFWTQHGQRIRQIAQTVIRGAIEAVRTVINHYRTTAQTVLQAVGQLWQTHGGTVRQIGTQIANSLRQLAERFGLVRQNGQPAIDTLVQTALKLKMLFSPLGRVITLVREMAQAWQTDLMGMRTATMENLPAISTTVSGESQSWSQAIDQATQQITQFWETRLVPLVEQTQQLFDQITEAIVAAMSFVVSEFLAPLLGDLVELWQTHFDDTVQNTIGAMDAIQQKITAALGAIHELWQRHGDEITAVVEFAFDSIRLFITTMLDTLLSVINATLLAIQGDWQGALDAIVAVTQRNFDRVMSFVNEWGSRVVSAIQSMASDVASEVRSMASDVRSEFESLVREATVAAGNIASNFLSGIQNMASNAVSEVSSMASDLVSEVTSIASDFRSAGSDMIDALADGIRASADKATGAVDNVVEGVRDKLPGSDAEEGPLSDLTDASVAIPETMAAKIDSNTRQPARAAEHLAAGIREGLSTAPTAPQARAVGGGSGGKNVTFQRGAIDVTIEGDASEADVNRGLTRALRSYNLD